MEPGSEPESAALARRREEIEHHLVALVSTELVDEYRNRPRGGHSPALALILSYFRQAPIAGKLALLSPEQHGAWKIVVLSRDQGRPHQILESDFASENAAAQEVFLRRLSQIGVTVGRTVPVEDN